MRPIAIIDCAINIPSYNCMNKIVEEHGIPVTYHWVSTHGLSSLDFINEASGYIIFGGDSNVADRLKWQIDLASFMKEKIEKAIPTLGICFGHQLIADAYGATVDLVTEDNICFEGTRKQRVLNNSHGFRKDEILETFISHHYEIKNLPENFIHLSSSKDCFYDGIAHKTLPYVSFQGHPEASLNFVKNDLDNPLADESIQNGLDGGSYIIKKFIDLVRQNS